MEFEFDNQEENYPIILLPNKIYKSLTEKIDDSQIEKELGITKPKKHIPIKPQAPSSFKYVQSYKTEFKHTEHSGCIILIFIASIILSFFIADSFLDGLKFILFGTLGYSAFLALMLMFNGESMFKVQSKTDYIQVPLSEEEIKKSELDYKEKIEKYNNDLSSINHQYNKELNLYLNTLKTKKPLVVKELFTRNIQPDINATRGKISIKRGIAELMFLEKLDKEFKGLIFVDMVPRVNAYSSNNVYNPDFTLICNKTNLHIDIEIDEPYSITDKTPIHYKGSSDERRNDFFLEKNWCVIRFSERQVINQTKECIETIRSIYHNILDMNFYYTSSLKQDPRWTYEESLILHKNKYRESYLS